MADGRKITYYDESSTALRDHRDDRPLQPVLSTSEVRIDPFSQERVVVAGHRQGRTHLPPKDECPLCPSTSDRRTEIGATSYDVVVFDNRFPSLPSDDGAARCQVVCFTDDHHASFGELPASRVRTVIEAWADRTCALSAMPGVEQVLCFENRGTEIGVTLEHPHGQIYAYPFVVPRTAAILNTAEQYRSDHGTCLFCDVLAREIGQNERIVEVSQHWAVLVPYAPRWPFEVKVMSRRHLPDLPSLEQAEIDDLAALLPRTVRRLDALFGVAMPYVAAWQQAPVTQQRSVAHLHLELFSTRRSRTKLKYLAGSETAAGVFINDVLPEDAARMLRDALN